MIGVMTKQMYRIRCHQCDNEFMAGGMLLRGLYDYSLLMFCRECPNCGSLRIMPEMFEDDELQIENYHCYWEQQEREAKMKEEKRLN